MTKQLITIDSILEINVDSSKYYNEINALNQLKAGMILIYNNIKPTELVLCEKYAGSEVSFFGKYPDMPDQLFKLIPCFFHWFGNSICNYARLSGYIVSREKNKITDDDIQFEPNRNIIKKACDEYVNNLIEIK